MADEWGNSDKDGGGGGEHADEVQAILESIDESGDDGGVAATAEDADDELDTDPRVERFGLYAGGVTTLILALMLFVGPWRLIEVTFEAGAIPFALRDSTEGNIFVAGAMAMLLVGVVVGAIYRATTEDMPEDYRMGIVANVIVVQVVAALALFVLVVLVPIGESLLSGDLVGTALLVVVSIVYLVFFTFFEFIGICLYVGIPTYVGVFVGDLFGRIL